MFLQKNCVYEENRSKILKNYIKLLRTKLRLHLILEHQHQKRFCRLMNKLKDKPKTFHFEHVLAELRDRIREFYGLLQCLCFA
jgi:hypothetical protein